MDRFTLFLTFFSVMSLWGVYRIYRKTRKSVKQASHGFVMSTWDDAYNRAVHAGKGRYAATVDAVKALEADIDILTVWNYHYNRAVEAGMTPERSERTASEGVKQAALKYMMKPLAKSKKPPVKKAAGK